MQVKSDSSFYVIWHLMILGALGYGLVFATSDMVFNFGLSPVYAAAEAFFSTLFFADMFVSAKYFFPRQANLETGEKPYRQTVWIGIDFLGAIPIELLLYFGGGIVPVALIRAMRIFRLVRFAKAYRAIQEIRKSVFFLNLHNAVKLGLVLTLVLFFAHILACGWIMLNPLPAGDAIIDHYVKCFYFIMTTLTTIGYGDITPQTTVARLYTIVIQLMGVAVFGVVIGQISKLIMAQNKHEEAQKEKKNDMILLLNHYGVPSNLQKQVFAYHHHLSEKHLTDNDGALIGELPEALQEEIRLYMKLKLLHGMALFQQLSEACLRDVALTLKKRHFSPHDMIIHKGDPARELFVIGHGTVNVLAPDRKIIVSLNKGQFFGEVALLKDCTRTTDVEAANYCDLYTFEKEDFLRIIKTHPDLQEKIQTTFNRRYSDKEPPVPVKKAA